MIFPLLTFVLLLIIQIALSLISYFSIKHLYSKFNVPLESGSDLVSTLGEYIKQYREVGASVDSKTSFIAKAHDEHIELNKKAMYRIDLFSHVYLVYQLEMTSIKNKSLRQNTLLLSLFLIEILLFVAPLILFKDDFIGIVFAWSAVIVQVIILAFSLYQTRLLSLVLNSTIEKLETITHLNHEELEMIEELADSLRLRILNYPLKSVQIIINFITP